MAFTFGKKISTRRRVGRAVRADANRWAARRRWLLNGLLLLALWGFAVWCICLTGMQRYVGLAEGQKAPATVVAAVDFESVDTSATELNRRRIADSVPPVFSVNQSKLQAGLRSLDKLVDRIISVRTTPPDPASGETIEMVVDEVSDLLDIPLRAPDILSLFPHGQEDAVGGVLKDAFVAIWQEGIVDEENRRSEFQGLALNHVIDIATPEQTGDYRRVTLRSISLPEEAGARYDEQVVARLKDIGFPLPGPGISGRLASHWFTPNLDYGERATRERRLTVLRGIEPIMMTVRAGTTLMEERTTVTAQTVEWISAHNRRMAELETPKTRHIKQVGDATLTLLILLLTSGWLYRIEKKQLATPWRKWLLVLLATSSIGISSLFHYISMDLHWIPSWLVPYAIPFSLATMLACLMLGSRAALAMSMWTALAIALMFDRNFELFLLGLTASVTALLCLKNVRKRSQVMRAGLWSGVAKAALAVALAATHQHVLHTLGTQVVVGIISGLVSAVLVTVLLPFLEWLFKYTSDITLLELTDSTHPLLQRLAIEAPGTSHHSLVVGTIAQAAANRIGANGLVVAVCAGFHDIGKLAKPEFFTENQHGGINPHDDLAPGMSALVIQSHVKEGLSLAKRYKLPAVVRDAIAAHHGTSLTSYFYQIAKRQAEESGNPADPSLEQNFRYSGPKPWTREQAILMLADIVEAASRSMDKATPHRLEELVGDLISGKILDGQLDHSPLTLSELYQIRDSFTFSLINIAHRRTPYPPRENSITQPAESPAGGSAPVASPHP